MPHRGNNSEEFDVHQDSATPTVEEAYTKEYGAYKNPVDAHRPKETKPNNQIPLPAKIKG